MPETTRPVTPTEIDGEDIRPEVNTPEPSESNTAPETVNPTTVANTAKKRKRIKPRSMEEILQTKPSKLTEVEKLMYIEYLEAESTKFYAQAEAYKNNAEASLKKANHMEEQIRMYHEKFFDIQQTLAVAYKAINNIINECN